MPLFSRGRDDTRREERDARSLASIEAGGIPVAAQERLAEVRSRGGRFFTSDLSVNEFLLAREAGFTPVTQVMGSSVYHVGWQWMPYASGSQFSMGGVTELDTQTEAWNEARRLALGRLTEEATRAGADAVVGVRLSRRGYDWAGELVEFTSFGTAVRSHRYKLDGGPVLSNLSGQDFAKLFAGGYWPVGVVAASTVTYVVASWATQSAQSGWFSGRQNQELTDYTQGLYDARTNAIARLQRQAHELGAHGVVGVQLDQHHEAHDVDRGNRKQTDLMVTLHVIGTAIVELRRDGARPPVSIALPLKETQ